jgi:hypothetical protein
MKDTGMMYHITGLCPRTDTDLSRCNFSIKLYPAWKEAVVKSKLNQGNIKTYIKNLHRYWLDGCGYGRKYDPDKDPLDDWKEKHLGEAARLGPNAKYLYEEHHIRILWGEWGPEHITVPGDACGLDLTDSIASPQDGKVLSPHNIDSMSQVLLLLTIFTDVADHIIPHGY